MSSKKRKAMFQDLYQTLLCIELEFGESSEDVVQVVRDEVSNLEWLVNGDDQ